MCHRLDVGLVTDNGPAVGRAREELLVHGHVELEERVVQIASELLEHGATLDVHLLLDELEMGHAIGLELHQTAQLVLRHALEVDRRVRSGERVLDAAVGAGETREDNPGSGCCSLEEEMLEEVREPGLSGSLVSRSDPVPDRMTDDRQAVIVDYIAFEAVGEAEAREAARLLADRGNGNGCEGTRGSKEPQHPSGETDGRLHRCLTP